MNIKTVKGVLNKNTINSFKVVNGNQFTANKLSYWLIKDNTIILKQFVI